jgi:hypothetical protein
LNKEINYLTDTIKVMLCTSSYSPDQNGHVYKSHISGETANGNGYTSGGIALSNKTLTCDSTTNTVKLDADDALWENASITARYAVIYNDTPAGDASKPLLGYVDFGKDVTSTDADFKIVWDVNGLLKATAS